MDDSANTIEVIRPCPQCAVDDDWLDDEVWREGAATCGMNVYNKREDHVGASVITLTEEGGRLGDGYSYPVPDGYGHSTLRRLITEWEDV